MASEYHRGTMDIHEQQNTYHAFGVASKWGSLAIAVAVLTTTIWFCTDGGFVAGAGAGLVLTVLGIVFLREKKSSGH